MRAYGLAAADEPPDYLDLPVPQPGAGEIRIRVLATSVNPVDAMVASGFFRAAQPYHYPAAVGRDVCGSVDALGSGATRFAVGDRVWGFIKRDHVGDGTFAEYVTCPQDHFVTAVADGTSTVEAGAMGLASITALDSYDALQLRSGSTVLVNGAAGGVGSFAVQIAVALGATVFATARPGRATEFVAGLGAHRVIDWTQGNVAATVRRLVPDGVDGLIDLVRWYDPQRMQEDLPLGRKAFADFAEAVLRPGGRYTSTTNAADPDSLAGVNIHSTPAVASLERITSLVENGSVRTPIEAVYPFDGLPEAFAHLEAGALGKVAVTLSQ
jgi:NADPH:quinone reductase-like Zn-dependent oxidoreductase